jgi:TonB family protein
LVTTSGKKASSFIGLDVPILTSTAETEAGTASTNVEFRQTGVLLTMTPTVHTGALHRKVTTQIEAEISGIDTGSALTLQGNRVPGFRVRKAQTEVTAESGETIVIAGLLEAEDSKAMSQVPALGSMPLIGRLFRSPTSEMTEREIVIAMTPELLVEEDVSTDRLLALEQALGKDIQDPGDKPLYDYATQVQQHLAEGIGYPESIKAAGTSGRVKLRLHLRANGTLDEVTASQSSGVKEFDDEALNAAKRRAPYPPIPEAVGRPDVWLDVPVIFNPLALDQAIGEAFGQAVQAGLPEDSPLRIYAARLQERLARGIQFPEREKQMGASGQVQLRLHVMRTGALTDAVVIQSSGLPALDRVALEAAVRQSPYPPFPKEVTQPEVWLDLPVLFSP